MHINNEQLNKYIIGRMPAEEQIKLMEHISECEFCAGRFAAAMQKRELIKTPPDLKNSILEQTVYKKQIQLKTDVLSSESIIGRRRKRKKEFWLYTANVTLAMCIAVMMIMTSDYTLSGSGNSSFSQRISITKEITHYDSGDNSKILDLIRNKSLKISGGLSKAIKTIGKQ